jgi:hypothetical protein
MLNTTATISRGRLELNKLVLDYSIPYCYNESVAYLKYIRDQSSLVVPLEREAQTAI